MIHGYTICAFLLVVKPLASAYSTFSKLSAYSTLCLVCLKSFCFLLIRYFTKSSKNPACLCFFLFFLRACVRARSLLLSVSLSLFFLSFAGTLCPQLSNSFLSAEVPMLNWKKSTRSSGK